ncbi:M23 family metallopeptidase [Campylobacter sp. LR264d]|uniref:M23 family metallopeptidase n=1 Tax=Campylobacter sp. LR264d TaxID=2593544 RepID=UPI00123841A9|nr:M23 family metallopeptidase [Campylobacter sp. LR264d]KAA6234147.1 M23 family metallopeptidase [Campylobacter sp. LR264d]
MMSRTRKIIIKLAIFLVFILALLGVTTNVFDASKPEIIAENIIYSNSKDPILIDLKDKGSGIKNVKISLKQDNNNTSTTLIDDKFDNKNELSLQVNLPKPAYKEKIKSYILDIYVKDSSWWNFGNVAKKKIKLIIDDMSPKINILSNSYQIEQGGAASVVFSVDDANLDEVFIQTNKDKIFKVTPFVKQGFYTSLIAWDAKEEEFRAFVVAKDKAGNVSKERIKYYLLNRKYRVSKINLSDRFLDGKIKDLAELYGPKDKELTRFEQFKFVNETLRISNEDLIHNFTTNVPEDIIEDFKINLFLPLKNGKKVADFADHRYYYYDGKEVSQSYHMGLDLASIARAPIISNNSGKVVFADENGIYGLNLILYHGFGLYSLYGHCTDKYTEKDEEVGLNSTIATTGVSGLALGDHLHFGVLVQGVEVRPEQWQDRRWIENNIYKVLNDAKKTILGTNNETIDLSKSR